VACIVTLISLYSHELTILNSYHFDSIARQGKTRKARKSKGYTWKFKERKGKEIKARKGKEWKEKEIKGNAIIVSSPDHPGRVTSLNTSLVINSDAIV
jgi:hypothetical protein